MHNEKSMKIEYNVREKVRATLIDVVILVHNLHVYMKILLNTSQQEQTLNSSMM